MKKFSIILFILLFFSLLQAQNTKYNELKVKLEEMRSTWNVPGMAVGIVYKDSLVFAEGFGLKNINNTNDSVDAHTLFPIASNTKAFTATAIAMLVKEGKLEWDDKVNQHLPYFQLADNCVTKSFTISDMLCHRSGLKTFSGDLLWYGTDYTREEVVKKAALLNLKYDFRTSFGYSNIMYIAAGEVIGNVSNSTWDDFMMKRIFTPLEMSASVTSFKHIPTKSNITAPHNFLGDSVFPIEYLNWDNIGGAGAIISNVSDMSKWLRLQLNNGIWNQDTFFYAKDAALMQTPHVNFTVPYRQGSPFESRHFYGYGLGWTLFDYQGKKVIGHSGGYDGIISYSCIVPEEELGIVILTNANSSLYSAVLYTLLDTYLKEECDVDWSSLYFRGEKAGRTPETLPLVEAIKADLELNDYTGTYKCKLYGDVKVTLKNGQLKLDMVHTDIFEGDLIHYTNNQFRIKMQNVPSLPEGLVSFKVVDGVCKALTIKIKNPDFDFEEFYFIKQ